MVERNLFRGRGFIGGKDTRGQLPSHRRTTDVGEFVKAEGTHDGAEALGFVGVEATEEDGAVLCIGVCVCVCFVS